MQCSALHDSDKDISQAYLFAFLKRLAQPLVFLVLKLYFDCKVRDLRWNQQKKTLALAIVRSEIYDETNRKTTVALAIVRSEIYDETNRKTT